MKRIYFVLCALALLCTACKDDSYDATFISQTEISAHSSTADVLIYVCNQDGKLSRALVEEFGVYLSENPNPTEKNERLSFAIKDVAAYRKIYEEKGCYACTIDGLSANTTYYALPFISNRWGVVTGKAVSFITNGSAKVTTKAASQVAATSAKLNASIQLVGDNVKLEKRGFVISTSNNPAVGDAQTTNWAEVGKAGDYGVTVNELTGNTKYYFRGYAIVNKEIVYGNTMSFTTTAPDNAITMFLNNVTDITTSGANVSGSITIGKDIVGQMTECGFMCSTDPNPDVSNRVNWWYYNSKTDGDFKTWSGKKNLNGKFSGLAKNTTYYYRMYYYMGGRFYPDNVILSFTTLDNTQNYYSVAQIMDVYDALGLADGASSAGTYTVRGYVTQWKSGYPDYQNADFWIDDSANGSTTKLNCFRLTGVSDSDKRTLVVGDYIEAQNCHLTKYNGKAELTDGTFTVIKAASTGVPTLADFMGTYSCHAHKYNHDYTDWNNVVISTFTNTDDNNSKWVYVEGLYYGQSAYAAMGKFDEEKGFVRLWGDWYFEDNTCTLSALGNTPVNPTFNPCYVENSEKSYSLDNGSGNNYAGEILLKMNSDGTLSFTASDKADNNNHYANAYRFLYLYASDHSDTGYCSEAFWLDGTKLTKTSSASAPPRSLSRIKSSNR